MTRRTNSRIAGVTFLLYIVIGISTLMMSPGGGAGIESKLAAIAEHGPGVRMEYILGLLTSFFALILGVTLHAITRDEDPDLAMFALLCRAGEGMVALSVPVSLSLLWLATPAGADAPDARAAHTLALFLMKLSAWKVLICAILFAVGSTVFSYLFLRGRIVPRPLAWLGMVGSALLVALLPAQLAGFIIGPITQIIWIPVAIFEIVLAFWLIVKGANPAAGTLSHVRAG
jgi:hypothetical protein